MPPVTIPITTLPTLTQGAMQGDDVIPIVDVHDLDEAATGTTKKVTADVLTYPAVPRDGRAVGTLRTYNENNATFNVKDFGAVGDGATNDTVAIQAAITAATAVSSASASGAVVYAPPGTYLVSAQIVVPARVTIVGAGTRSTRLISSYTGYAIKIGTTSSSLAYGNGITDLSISMTNAAGGAIQAIGTAGFYARNLYIEGLVSSTNQGIFLDGGDAANIFSVLDNIDCNHVKFGLRLGTSGSQTTTSVTALGFNALNDLVAGGYGIKVDALHGNGSRFFGGNLENCAVGVQIAGFACQFFGVRFEANTTALLLDSGAEGNVFVGCAGWTEGTITNNSGTTTNSFWGNHASTYVNYPLDTLSRILGGLTFGPDSASLTNPTAIPIANNATGTLTIGNACTLLVYDSGVTADMAMLLLTAGSGGTKVTIVSQNGTTFTTTPTTASKINFSVSGSTLSIENKLGSDTVVRLMLATLA